MIQQSEVPVLAIPRQASFNDFEQILFATEYQDGDLTALKHVAELAGLFNSNIRVIHASEEAGLKADASFRGFKQLVDETIPYKNMDFYHATAISLFEVVADQVELHNISLLVMMRYQKPFSIFRRKQTKEMSFYTEVPLLVLPVNN